MIDLRLLNLQEGDSQADVANKLNYNFNQIVNAGGGAYGQIGIGGAPGFAGLTGFTGPAGFQGSRGNFWFVESEFPATGSTGAKAGDYWVNLSNDCEVYLYNGSIWETQGFLISQSGVFEIAGSTTGLTSGPPSQAYVIALPTPSERTLVLTGASGPGVKNPQLSKVVLGNIGTSGYPLLEFSKYGYQNSSYFNSITPKIKWSSNTSASSENYGLKIEARGGLKFNTSYFSLVSNSSLTLNSTGITGSFSGSINYTAATGNFSFSSTNLSINSLNATWSNSGFTGPVSFSVANNNPDLINTGRNTMLIQNGITYNRQTSYTTGQNLFRVRYKPASTYSGYGPYINTARNLYTVDSDGNNKFSKKTSGYFPNPQTVSSYNNTSTFNWSAKTISGEYVYSVGAASSTTTNTNLMRHQIGEFFLPDVFTGGAGGTGGQALSIFVPNSASSSKTGYGYLVGVGETMTFRVNSTTTGYAFNAIILDAPTSSNNPTTTTTSYTGSTNKNIVLLGDLVEPAANSNVYADQFEINLLRLSTNRWIVYFKAWGGNLASYTSVDNGILCGTLTTQS